MTAPRAHLCHPPRDSLTRLLAVTCAVSLLILTMAAAVASGQSHAYSAQPQPAHPLRLRKTACPPHSAPVSERCALFWGAVTDTPTAALHGDAPFDAPPNGSPGCVQPAGTDAPP